MCGISSAGPTCLTLLCWGRCSPWNDTISTVAGYFPEGEPRFQYRSVSSSYILQSFDIGSGAPGENGEWESAAALGQDIEVASAEGSDDGQEDSVESVGMTPFADLLNARYGCENVGLEIESFVISATGGTNQIDHFHKAHLCYDTALQMIATANIPAGSQIVRSLNLRRPVVR